MVGFFFAINIPEKSARRRGAVGLAPPAHPGDVACPLQRLDGTREPASGRGQEPAAKASPAQGGQAAAEARPLRRKIRRHSPRPREQVRKGDGKPPGQDSSGPSRRRARVRRAGAVGPGRARRAARQAMMPEKDDACRTARETLAEFKGGDVAADHGPVEPYGVRLGWASNNGCQPRRRLPSMSARDRVAPSPPRLVGEVQPEIARGGGCASCWGRAVGGEERWLPSARSGLRAGGIATWPRAAPLIPAATGPQIGGINAIITSDLPLPAQEDLRSDDRPRCRALDVQGPARPPPSRRHQQQEPPVLRVGRRDERGTPARGQRARNIGFTEVVDGKGSGIPVAGHAHRHRRSPRHAAAHPRSSVTEGKLPSIVVVVDELAD